MPIYPDAKSIPFVPTVGGVATTIADRLDKSIYVSDASSAIAAVAALVSAGGGVLNVASSISTNQQLDLRSAVVPIIIRGKDGRGTNGTKTAWNYTGTWPELSVSSATESGGTVTVTTALAHGYSTGMIVSIIGATPVAYNGPYTITVTGSTTFAYTCDTTALASATGTITASVPGILVGSSRNVTFERLAISYSSSVYGGILLDATKVASDTAYLSFHHCRVFGPSGGVAKALICLNGSHDILFHATAFKNATVGVIGKLTQGLTPRSGFAINVKFEGNCTFDGFVTVGIKNADESWVVDATFEPISSGAAAAYSHDSGVLANGLTFRGCWMGDDNAAVAGTWIKFAGSALSVLGGNVISCNQLTTGILIDGNSCTGIAVVGNSFDLGSGSSKGVDFGVTTGHSGVVVLGNSWGTVQAPIAGTIPAGAIYDSRTGPVFGNLTLTGTITGAAVVSSGNVSGSSGVFGANASQNLLSASQADLEAGNTTGIGVNTNCTFAVSTDVAAHGTRSLKVTAGNTSDTDASVQIYTGFRPASTPGVRYYCQASVRAATTPRWVQLDIYSYDAGGAGTRILQFHAGNDSTAGWTTLSGNAVAPAGSVNIGMVLRVGAPGIDIPANGEVHYWDKLQITTDSSGAWFPPGVTQLQLSGTTMVQVGTVTDGDAGIAPKGTGAVNLALDSGTGGVNFGNGLGGVPAKVNNVGIFYIGTFTVAGLPAAGTAGRMAFATNGRKNGEGAASGTGVLIFDDGTAWRACDTGATVAA